MIKGKIKAEEAVCTQFLLQPSQRCRQIQLSINKSLFLPFLLSCLLFKKCFTHLMFSYYCKVTSRVFKGASKYNVLLSKDWN